MCVCVCVCASARPNSNTIRCVLLILPIQRLKVVGLRSAMVLQCARHESNKGYEEGDGEDKRATQAKLGCTEFKPGSWSSVRGDAFLNKNGQAFIYGRVSSRKRWIRSSSSKLLPGVRHSCS